MHANGQLLPVKAQQLKLKSADSLANAIDKTIKQVMWSKIVGETE
jgi:hypothetical protein